MFTIIKYPHPLLKKRLSHVEKFDSELKFIVRDMFETMYAYNGIGLAANQVGLDLQIVIVDIGYKEKNKSIPPLVLINPKITKSSNKKVIAEEGCLSFPGYYDNVKRAESIVVEYYDINGKKKELIAKNLLSRVLQHEIDHINGVSFIQRMSPDKQLKFYAFYFLGKYKF
ncbi:MAG: peptide deformylase [Elusimicrobiota bacterium]|nr:peptide deformylase [Endomicrobiia bacterium]MCX7911049.1 peptide deformylase [Endomicrobiia bacterium]MDW8165809.1 peptide deformylase [Elusimicrobiota bacterium]